MSRSFSFSLTAEMCFADVVLFESLNILKLQDINNFQIAICINIIIIVCHYYLMTCSNANITHSYYTRHSNALQLPAVRTILRKRSIVFMGPLRLMWLIVQAQNPLYAQYNIHATACMSAQA